MFVDIRFGAPNGQNKAEVYTLLLYFDQTWVTIAGYRINVWKSQAVAKG